MINYQSLLQLRISIIIRLKEITPHGYATYPKAIAAANHVFVIWRLDKPAYSEDSFIFRYSDDNGTTFYNSFMVNTATSMSGNVQFLYGNNYLHFFWLT